MASNDRAASRWTSRLSAWNTMSPSQSRPSHRSDARMFSTSSELDRSRSVSSTRRSISPPVRRASSQLNSAARALPTWRYPVGEGAKRSRGGCSELTARGYRCERRAPEERPSAASVAGERQDWLPVRVLLVSDLHYDLRKLDWVLAQAADVDLLVVAGDLLDIASGVPLDAQIVVVLEYLARFADRTTTVVCSGNHDLDHRTDERREGHPLDPRRPRVGRGGRRRQHRRSAAGSITSCAWWEGPATLRRAGGRPGSGRRAAGRTVALGVPRPARGPAVVDRVAPLRRSRAPPAARAAPPRRRAVRPHPPGAVRGRRRLGRAAGHARGCSTAATSAGRRPATCSSTSTSARRRGGRPRAPARCRWALGSPAGSPVELSSRASGRSRARCRRAGATRAGRAPSRTR